MSKYEYLSLIVIVGNTNVFHTLKEFWQSHAKQSWLTTCILSSKEKLFKKKYKLSINFVLMNFNPEETMREKCSYLEFFCPISSRIYSKSPRSVRIWENKNHNTDSFYAIKIIITSFHEVSIYCRFG